MLSWKFYGAVIVVVVVVGCRQPKCRGPRQRGWARQGDALSSVQCIPPCVLLSLIKVDAASHVHVTNS